MTFGVAGAGVLPLGDYGDVANLALGAFGTLDYPINPSITATGRVGLLYHLVDSNFDGTLVFVPILGGIKYHFDPAPGGAYLAGELGLNVGYVRVSTPFGSSSDTDTELALSLGGGFETGRLDVRASLFFPDVSDLYGLLVTVGYAL